jgi:hypothetical protein
MGKPLTAIFIKMRRHNKNLYSPLIVRLPGAAICNSHGHVIHA